MGKNSLKKRLYLFKGSPINMDHRDHRKEGGHQATFIKTGTCFKKKMLKAAGKGDLTSEAAPWSSTRAHSNSNNSNHLTDRKESQVNARRSTPTRKVEGIFSEANLLKKFDRSGDGPRRIRRHEGREGDLIS